MNKERKIYIDEECKNIYSNLNINWTKGLKNKIEEINDKGLANSGMEQKMLINYAINLINETTINIKNLIEKSQQKFEFKMSKKEIEKYITQSINNNINYINKFEKDLEKHFKNKGLTLTESCKSQLINSKCNNKIELEKIKKELILLNKSKAKKERQFTKSDIIAIISIIVAILLFRLELILTK